MKKTILIVDDEKELCKILSDSLFQDHYRVLVAFEGKRALQLVKEEKPDLILLDIKMPRMNGIDAIKILKQDPDMTNIHILVLTAMESGDKEMEFANIGINDNDIITKPFSPKELLDIINARIGEE